MLELFTIVAVFLPCILLIYLRLIYECDVITIDRKDQCCCIERNKHFLKFIYTHQNAKFTYFKLQILPPQLSPNLNILQQTKKVRP